MTAEQPEELEGVRVGLCTSCLHAKALETKIGATIYLCGLAAKNPRFRRFPQVPVLACEGFEKSPNPEEAES